MSKSFKYVKDFEFPYEAGFSGSSGQQMVKGYARGGCAKGGKPAHNCCKDGGLTSFGSKGQAKVGKVMGEFKSGELHSGSKKGPEVLSKKQAVAIALSEARKANKKK